MEMNILNKLRCWRESLKAANAARHTAEINARFSLREKNGRIYLICGSTAFAEIPKTTDKRQVQSV